MYVYVYIYIRIYGKLHMFEDTLLKDICDKSILLFKIVISIIKSIV